MPDRFYDALIRLDRAELQAIVSGASDSALALAAFRHLRRFRTTAPDPDCANAACVTLAEAALHAYAERCGNAPSKPDQQFVDLISDLLHLIDLTARFPHRMLPPRGQTEFLVADHGDREIGEIFDPFLLLERAISKFASEMMRPQGDGPELKATVLLDGVPPAHAAEAARRSSHRHRHD